MAIKHNVPHFQCEGNKTRFALIEPQEQLAKFRAASALWEKVRLRDAFE